MKTIKKTIKKISAHLWLKKYGVKNYTLSEDDYYGLIVDVAGDVDLSHKKLTSIYIKFNHVTGNFFCDNNQLTTLEHCPTSVEASFWCNNNQLMSLEDSPTSVGGDFWCNNNKLTSLKYSPKLVRGNFWCNNNKLTNLEGSPLAVGCNFYCFNNLSLQIYQTFTNFAELKEKITSDKERALLLTSLQSPLKASLHKL